MLKLRKLLIPFLVVLLLSIQMKASELRCWDGTFAYDTAYVRERENHVELSVMGGFMGPLTFDVFDEEVSIAQWDQRTRLHTRFSNEECLVSDEKWTCDKIAPDNFGHRVSFFIERSVRDLGDYISVISPVEAKRLIVNFEKNGEFELKIIGAKYAGEDVVDEQIIAFPMSHCDGSGFFMPHLKDLEFPERLKQHLNIK